MELSAQGWPKWRSRTIEALDARFAAVSLADVWRRCVCVLFAQSGMSHDDGGAGHDR